MAIKHLEEIERLLRDSKEPLSVNYLQETTGFNWRTIKESLSYLESQGNVSIDKNGLWKARGKR